MVFSPKDSSLGGVLLARMMAGPLALLLVFLMGSLPLLRAVESKWLNRDEVTRHEPALGGRNKLEATSVQERVDVYLKALGDPLNRRED